MNELKSCPRCGKQPTVYAGYNSGFEHYQYICPGCLKAGETKLTKEGAKESWNERAGGMK